MAAPRGGGVTDLAELARFTAELPFSLDDFQQRACAALERGHGVLVCATTGAGKTVVGGHRQVVGQVWCCQDWSVAIAARYKGYRYSIEVIGHVVWLYHCFALSLRDVEELMLARGVVVTYETIRSWCGKFGPDYANQLRRRRPRPGDKWHLDEVFVKINGVTHYLWRAVDQHGEVLDVLVQSRRNAVAAKRFFRKLLKGLRYVPRVIVTDKLASYQPAHRQLLPSVIHRRSKYLNNRAENSHQSTRIRERVMKRFASPGQAQRFLFAFSHIRQHFRPRRHLMSAPHWRIEMTNRFAVWDEITAPQRHEKPLSANILRHLIHSHRLRPNHSQIT